MLPLPAAIIAVLRPFAPVFSRPVWRHAQVLLVGAVVCRGARTVAAVLRVMGLGEEQRFAKYHRVLSRARWSGLQGSKILLGLLVHLLPASWPIVIGPDDTIEHRRRKKINAQGCYRDAVRSTAQHVVTCFGLKWVTMMLLVPLVCPENRNQLKFLIFVLAIIILAQRHFANPSTARHKGSDHAIRCFDTSHLYHNLVPIPPLRADGTHRLTPSSRGLQTERLPPKASAYRSLALGLAVAPVAPLATGAGVRPAPYSHRLAEETVPRLLAERLIAQHVDHAA